MPKKSACINFDLCSPHVCDNINGNCIAVGACKKKLLEQEDPFEIPNLLSGSLCHGCAACQNACPLHAITIV
ncbi:MAG: 4Fe-4S binding protein [Spirochaetales bacterium]|nr:4Fe-4S binding protein [Spirochaetales bacterium]